jgi:purine-binding chemotaxis protein CheW
VQGQASILVFQVAGKSFGLALENVEKIVDFQMPTRTPRRPAYVEGVMEHRGLFLPVVNLRQRLGVASAGPAHPAVLIVTGVGHDPGVCLVVDQVLRVMSLAVESVLAPPPKVFGIRAEFIRGIANADGRAIVWLDPVRLLASSEPIALLA